MTHCPSSSEFPELLITVTLTFSCLSFREANDLRAQITGTKESVRGMRQERDVSCYDLLLDDVTEMCAVCCYRSLSSLAQALHRRVSQVRQEEDEIKRKTFSEKSRSEELKREVEALFVQKRALTSHFRSQEKEYKDFIAQLRQKQKQQLVMRKQEERAKKEKEM